MAEVARVLYGREDVRRRVAELGRTITGDYVGREPVFVTVLKGAASVELCALLDKTARRIVPIRPRYAGFDCPDSFVVGYGLDFRERYRNLPDILQVYDLAALSADPDALRSSAPPAA